MKFDNRITIPLERYEELLRKEFLATSILNNNYLTIDQVEWLKNNYNEISKFN